MLIGHRRLTQVLPLKIEVVTTGAAEINGNTIWCGEGVVPIHIEIAFIGRGIIAVVKNVMVGVPNLGEYGTKNTGRIGLCLTLKLRVSALSAGC